jgi:hypothetical protein
MPHRPFQIDTLQTSTKTRAERFSQNLRAFFCLCLLLPLYAVPERQAPHSAGTGMDAPPPVLESSSRLGAFGGLERRLLGGPQAASNWWPVQRVWHISTPLQPVQPLERVTLAEFQQWRLEGG